MRRGAALVLLALLGCAAPSALPPGSVPPPVVPPPEPPPPPADPPPPVLQVAADPEPAGPSSALRLHGARADLGQNVAQGSGSAPHVAGPSVDVGPVTGAAGISDAARVIAALRPGFRRCYARALEQDPNLAGVAALHWNIGPGGEVMGANVTGGAALPPALVNCLLGIVRAAQFSRPPGGGATLTMPITMTR